MSEELKSCPFCGAKAEFSDLSYLTGKPSWCISCTSSKCFAPHTDTCSKKEAVKRWNNRPAEEALQKQIAELEKSVEACRLANRVLRHKQKELRAKLNQWRKVLEEIAESDNGVDEDGLSCFFCDHMIYIAQKALKGEGE